MHKSAPIIASIFITLLAASTSFGVKIGDITRVDGERTSTLTGMGLVTGLNGTGDGGDFLPAMRSLAGVLTNLKNNTPITDLSAAKNVAIVTLSATIPGSGVRDGDALDVYVTSVGAAKSLKGGRLFTCGMFGPFVKGVVKPLAFSQGGVEIEDPTSPNAGVIHGGCVMELTLPPKAVDSTNHFRLILDQPSASWTTATTIATIINDLSDSKEETLATAVDSKTIVVAVPPTEIKHPEAFISRVQQLPVLLLPTEARVLINDRTGTMIMTGDVEISATVISKRGLTISTTDPKPIPTARNPVTTVKDVVTMDTTQQGGAKLQDLAVAFDQLKVPIEDRIAIVRELYHSGKLHAKLIENGL